MASYLVLNRRTVLLIAILAALIKGTVYGQWLTGGTFNEQYLSPGNPGVIIGTTSASPPSALTVRGDQLPTPTGEVFRTDAPLNSNTSWRLLRGGNNVARFFNNSTDLHMNYDALRGHHRWHTFSALRMQLTQPQLTTINGFSIQQDGFLGLSGNANLFTGVGPFSRLHLADVSNNTNLRGHLKNSLIS